MGSTVGSTVSALVVVGVATADIVHDEAVDGEPSDQGSNPTFIDFSEGVNDILFVTDSASDRNIFLEMGTAFGTIGYDGPRGPGSDTIWAKENGPSVDTWNLGFVVNQVTAPGAIAVFGLAGLAARRRRDRVHREWTRIHPAGIRQIRDHDHGGVPLKGTPPSFQRFLALLVLEASCPLCQNQS